MSDNETLAEITSCWDLRYRKTRPDLRLAGSPERTEYRAVVEDDEGGLWVLEKISPATLELKQNIIRTLALLHDRGLRAVHPYRTSRENESIVRVGGDHWQLVPYVGGTSLPRPDYVQERWRGKACAGFLLDLRDKAREVPFFDRERPFSIMVFIRELSDKLARHAPDLFQLLRPVVEILEQEFAPVHDAMPVAFCHGDIHPINVIWSQDRIRSVIDWEFLGYKPEIYDTANLIGCVGMEDPAALVDGFVLETIALLREADVFSPAGWESLVEFTAAIRFAWLSDWLRRGDREMIELETSYIQLLMENRKSILARWRP
jgi:homoserine kinase type II